MPLIDGTPQRAGEPAAFPSMDQLAAAMRDQLGLSADDATRTAALAVAAATATRDFVDQLRAAVLEAEGIAADLTVERQLYAMGLRVAAGLYGLPEGADPDTRRQADPDPMPVFPILAKDRFAPAAVDAYQRICENAGSTDQAHQVALAAQEIRDWQRRNPSQVQFPHHEHVPATGR